MVAWALYVTLVGSVLGGAGALAERGLRRLGRPVRGVWVVAMAGSVGLPLVTAARLLLAAAAAGPVAGAGAPTAGAATWSALPAGSGSSAVTFGFLAAWAATSLVLLANVRLSTWTVRRNERTWRSAMVAGRRVAVSSDFGPGVIGAVRPRIVLPAWLWDADPGIRETIVRHEVEHVRARDTRLLLAGVLLVALLPWCLPLLWQLHRLRAAIETDCDARVVDATGEPRAYAEALVAVAGRTGRRLTPVPALAPRRSELERRIRLVLGRRRHRTTRTAPALLAAATFAALALLAVPAPRLPTLDLEARPAPELPPSATVILTVAADRLDAPAAAR